MESDGENQSKKKKCKLEDEDQPRNGMDSLPRDIVLDILSRLPITSVIQFRFVSRAWRLMSLDHLLFHLHLTRASKNNPCLIFHCDYPIRNQLSFVELSDHGDKNELVRKIQTPFSSSMPEFNVVGSCNGLLCLSDSFYNDPLYVFNPFTRNNIQLPNSRQFQEQEVVFGFGAHPMTNEYKVVKIVYYRNPPHNGPWRLRRFRLRDFPQSEVQVFSLGSNAWTSIGKAPYQLERRSLEASFVNGRIHWVSRPGRYHGVRGRIIVSFDLGDEQFREVDKPDCGGLNKCNYHLAVLKGCLSAAVFCGYGKLEIWVMKEYGMKESWIKEFTVGAYSPKLLSQDLQQSYGIWRKALTGRMVRILCLLNNGEILLEYRGGTLASYNPHTGKFKSVTFEGMPSLFQTVVHVGSLNWIDIPINM